MINKEYMNALKSLIERYMGRPIDDIRAFNTYFNTYEILRYYRKLKENQNEQANGR